MVNDTGFYDGFTGSRGRILQFATGATVISDYMLHYKTIQTTIDQPFRAGFILCLLLIQRSAHLNLNLRER